MNYWQPKYELMAREELEDLQLRRLKSVAEKVYQNVPFYHKKFQEAGITPQDIRSLADISRLPTTRKQDLRDNYPFGLFAVPSKEEVVRVHASSGTTGKPTVVGYTAKDIETWSDLMARDFVMVGVGKEDIFQNAVNYGFFTGGLGVHYGIERMGAMAVPSGRGQHGEATRDHDGLRGDGPALHPLLCALSGGDCQGQRCGGQAPSAHRLLWEPSPGLRSREGSWRRLCT